MDAPKCRICGKKEYRHICGGGSHVEPDPKPKKTTPKPRSKPAQVDAGTTELLARVESLEARALDAEHRLSLLEGRKKYMRDYKRRKRAEAKKPGAADA